MDFTKLSLDELNSEDMQKVIRQGKAGTAMMAFSTLLSEKDISAVVAFVRQTFFKQNGEINQTKNTRYHTIENGWSNHDQYKIAYPFVLGEILLDTNVETLTSVQKQGRQLYLSACISCHDRAKVKEDGVIWQSFPLSWPRNTYSHKQEKQHDALSQASPYHIHDIKIIYNPKTKTEQLGQKIFQANCAFCHAPDGSGKNWIGQFIEPPARDFTKNSIQNIFTKQTLKDRIKSGVKNSAMPAWRYVLSEKEIDSLVSFMWLRFK